MAKRRFEMFEFRRFMVRILQGDYFLAIRRAGLMGRDTAKEVRGLALVHGWLDPDKPLPEDAALAAVFGTQQRPRATSQVEPYEEPVKRWLDQGLQATTIHSALQRIHGFTGSYSSVRRYLHKLNPEPQDRTMRLSFTPGESAQVDFGSGPRLPDPETGELRSTWIFVMTLCWSRHQYAEIVWDQTVMTWLGCHLRAFRFFGGVPRSVTVDNAKCAITKACAYDPEVQRSYAELAEAYGFKIDACPPRDPKKKGRVEAGVKYVKRSFLPARSFRNFADANRQLEIWVLETAGQRVHGTTREQPLWRFQETERALLQALPDRAYEPAAWRRLKLHKESHIRLDHCYYSAPWMAIGERLWVRAAATKVDIFRDHQLIATHVRCTRPGEASTVADHLPPECRSFLEQTPAWCREQAETVGEACRLLVDILLSDPVVERLRSVRKLLRLQETYGAARLESACRRALSFDASQYRTVKTILTKGLDAVALNQDAFDPLAGVYTGGGRYGRDVHAMLVH